MKLPTIFKQRSNKKYSYTPRYYNPDKERREQRQSMRRFKFQDDWKASRQRQSDKNTRLRFVVIVLVLFIVGMLAFRYWRSKMGI